MRITTAVLVSLIFTMGWSAHAAILLPNQSPDPAFAPLVFWLDASDNSTLTFSGGTTVQTWTDKSAGGRVATANNTGMSLGTGATHGQPTVKIPNVNGFNLNSDLVIPVNDADGMSAWMVAKTDPGTNRSTLMSRGGNNVQFFRETDGGGNGIIFFKGSNPDPNIPTAGVKTDHIHYAVMNSTLPNPDKVTYFVDGAAQTVNNNQNIGTQDWVLNRVGGNGGCCGSWKGEISEILIFDRKLTPEEEGDVGAYLEDKYGIPTSYDFSNGVPTITGLDGDSLLYEPGADGVQVIDQGVAATGDDPLPPGPAGWNGGNLTVSITTGGVPADDVLGILSEGGGAGQIAFSPPNVSFEGTAFGTAVIGSDIVVTFNASATSAAISALLDNITYLNANAATPPSTRHVSFTLADGDLATSAPSVVQIPMDVGGAVATHVWDGSGDGLDWNDGSNWDSNTVPDNNDIAIFRTDDPGPVDVGTAFAGELRFDGSGSYDLRNGTLNVVLIDQQAAASGDNIISVQVVGLGLTGTVSGGSLSIQNVANSITGNWTVNAGATLETTTEGSGSGIGSADVDLNGGELTFLPGAITTINGLDELWFDGGFNDANIDPIDTGAGFLTMAPGATSLTDGNLSYNGAAMNTRSGGLVGTDTIGAAWSGTLNVGANLPAGEITFGTRSDDGTVVWIDLDQNGDFEHTGAAGDEMVVNNKGFHGNRNRVGTRTLAAGAYDVAFGFFEGGGGEFVEVRFGPGAIAEAQYNNLAIVNPADAAQDGVFTVQQVGAGANVNNVAVNQPSELSLGANLPGVALGDLDLQASLTVNSADGEQTLSFVNTVLTGVNTITETGEARVTLSNVSGDGFTQDGDGCIILPTANTYTGLTTVNSGAVDFRANGALGTEAAGTIVNAGAALIMSSAIGYSGQEPVSIAGAGNAKANAAFLSTGGGGNREWRGRITATADALIRHTGGNVLLLRGVVDNGGFAVEMASDNEIQIRNGGQGNGGMQGAGSFTKTGGNRHIMIDDGTTNSFSGGLTVNDGIYDIRRNVGALGTGPVEVNNGGEIEFRDRVMTFSNAITISGGGNNNNNDGALRVENGGPITLDGDVTLDGNATIRTQAARLLTINGSIGGAFSLTKFGTGELVICGPANTYGSLALTEGTITACNDSGAGQSAILAIPGGTTFNWDASGGPIDLAGATVQEIALGGGNLNAVGGTVTVDVPVSIGLFSEARFGGDGDLVINSDVGNGGVATSGNGLSHFGFHINNDNLALDLDQNGGMVNGPPTAGIVFDPGAAFIIGTTANIDLGSAPAVIDGETLFAGDIVLVKNQADPVDNGIYDFAAPGAALSRNPFRAVGTDAANVTVTLNLGGQTGQTFHVNPAVPAIVGTDPINWITGTPAIIVNIDPPSAPGLNFFGQALLVDGPGGRGIDFNNDADWRNAGVVSQNDNISNLIIGFVNVSAANAGNWEFRRVADDDRMGIWLDIDQDGIFESTTPGLGSNRGEQLQFDNDGGVKTQTLAEGAYMVAFTHREGGGGSQLHVEFKHPNMGGRANVKPGDPAQAGIWTTLPAIPSNAISKNGPGALTFNGANSFNGDFAINGGTVIIGSDTGLGTTDGSTTVAQGAALELDGSGGDLDIGAEALSIGGTLRNLAGDNTGSGPLDSPGAGGAVIDSVAGSLDLLGSYNMGNNSLCATGDGELILRGVISGGLLPGVVPDLAGVTAELEIWLDASDIDGDSVPDGLADGTLINNWVDKSGNNRNFNDVLSDPNYVLTGTHGQPAVGFDGDDALRSNNANGNPRSFIDGNGEFTLISVSRYSGGDRERVIAAKSGHNWLFGYHGNSANRWHYDGWGSQDVGGALNNNNDWHVHSNQMNLFGDASNPAGDFYLDGVLKGNDSRGTGNSFNNNVPDGLSLGAWSGTRETSTAEVSELIMYNRVLSDAELQLVEAYLADKYGIPGTFITLPTFANTLSKKGTGTLVLEGANTYGGGTTVEGGALIVNNGAGSGTGPGDVIVLADGALGGTGSIDGGADLAAGADLLPGPLTGQLNVGGTLGLGATSTFGVDLLGTTTPGIDFDQLAAIGNVDLAGATLNLIIDPAFSGASLGDTIPIVTSVGGISGQFAGLPEGASILGTSSTPDFTISYNSPAGPVILTTFPPPTANDDTLIRPRNNQFFTLQIPRDVTGNDAPADPGESISVALVDTTSANGNAVFRSGDFIFYVPGVDQFTSDSFSYSILETGSNKLAAGTIFIEVQPEAPNQKMDSLVEASPGVWRASFSGTPNTTYVIEFDADLLAAPGFVPIGTVTSDATGKYFIDHNVVGVNSGCYRSLLPTGNP